MTAVGKDTMCKDESGWFWSHCFLSLFGTCVRRSGREACRILAVCARVRSMRLTSRARLSKSPDASHIGMNKCTKRPATLPIRVRTGVYYVPMK
jgi:hypothetical protein